VVSGDELISLAQHPGPVTAVAFCADGALLATAASTPTGAECTSSDRMTSIGHPVVMTGEVNRLRADAEPESSRNIAKCFRVAEIPLAYSGPGAGPVICCSHWRLSIRDSSSWSPIGLMPDAGMNRVYPAWSSAA
jgi:hypothetical protein